MSKSDMLREYAKKIGAKIIKVDGSYEKAYKAKQKVYEELKRKCICFDFVEIKKIN